MITLAGHAFPFAGHIFGNGYVFVCYIIHAQHACHFTVTGDTHYGFQRQVSIMCPVTGKVVCTELILWIESILHQVVSPDSQQIPVFLGIVGISFYHGNGCGKNNHVTTFFYRHVSAIYLSVCYRIYP